MPFDPSGRAPTEEQLEAIKKIKGGMKWGLPTGTNPLSPPNALTTATGVYKSPSLVYLTAKEFAKELPKEGWRTLVDIARALPRAAQMIAESSKLAMTGEVGEFVPETPFDKFLLGKKPVKDIATTGIDIMTEAGAPLDMAIKWGPGLGVAVATVDIYPPFKGGRGSKPLIKVVLGTAIRAVIKRQTRMSPEDYIRGIVKGIPDSDLNPIKTAQKIIRKKLPGLTGKETSQIVKQVEKQIGARQAWDIANKVTSTYLPPGLRQGAAKIVTVGERGALRERLKIQARSARVAATKVRTEGRLALTEQRRVARERLRDELSAKMMMFKAAQVALRESVTAALKGRMIEAAEVKRDIVELVKATIPMQERGKFLVMVRDAKTQRDLTKAFTRIDDAAERAEKRVLIRDLKESLRRVAKSPAIAVDYRQKVSELSELVELPEHRSTTMESIRKTKLFFEKKAAELMAKDLPLEDLEIPQRVARRLQILERIPVSELSAREIRSMTNEVERLAALGKTKGRVRENVVRFEQDAVIREITQQGTNPIQTRPRARKAPGEVLELGALVKDKMNAGLDVAAEKFNFSITFPDRYFDHLDGSPGTYAGAFFRNFKGRIDTRYHAYLNMRDEIQASTIQMVKDLKLTDQSLQRIGVHAARVQESGMAKLLNTGFTRAEIDEVVLSPNELKFYTHMRGVLDEMRDPVADVMRRVYNRELDVVEDYFPFLTDWNYMDQAPIHLRVGKTVEEFGQKTKNVEMDFTKTRLDTTGTQTIQVDALEIFQRHTDNAAYLINMGEDVKFLTEVAVRPEMTKLAGDTGQLFTLDWLDLISRKGGTVGAEQGRILDIFRRNITLAYLGLKLSSALIQPTAIFDGAGLIGRWAFKGLGSIVKEVPVKVAGKVTSHEYDTPWIDFIQKNMPEVRDRVGGEQALRELRQSIRSYGTVGTIRKGMGGKALARIEQGKGRVVDNALWGLQKLDMVTAMAVASGAYERALAKKGLMLDFANPDKEALEEAQLMVRLTQATGVFKDVPLALSKGKFTGIRALDKAIFTFQTFSLNQWNLLKYDAVRVGLVKSRSRENVQKALSIFTMFVVARMAERGIRSWQNKALAGLTGGETREEESFAKATLLEGLRTVPFMSQAMSIALYDGEPAPVLGALKKIPEGVYRAATSEKEETKARGAVAALSGLGALMGVPGSLQLEQLIVGRLRKKEKVGFPPKMGMPGGLPGEVIPQMGMPGGLPPK